jgi:hypothetical protein
LISIIQSYVGRVNGMHNSVQCISDSCGGGGGGVVAVGVNTEDD